MPGPASASTGSAPAIVIAGAERGTRAAFALREEGWDGRVILAGARAVSAVRAAAAVQDR